MPSRSSPSPSPPPTAPQPTTNELGPRAVALRKIYASALKSTIKSNSYPNFASCFPTPATYCPTALEGVWRQLNSRLEEECQKDFEKILEERKTIDGLNKLDLLLSQAVERRARAADGDEPVAMHTLTAQQLGDARMHNVLVRSSEELETKLKATQDENQRFMGEVRTQNDEIERMVASLEALVGDLDGAVKALEGVDKTELKGEIWEMEREIKMTD